MALPTLPRYWTSRKNVYEQAMVRQRNHENDFREKWGNTADYFQKNNIAANKQQVWESDGSLRGSMEKYKSLQDKDVKAKNLRRRRLKLAEMLKEERDDYEAELRGYSRENYSRLDLMKDRAESLKSAREEKRKQLAEEKLYEYWKQNNPDLRKIEADQHKDHVVNTWSDQVESARERQEKERMEKEKIELEMEEERLAAIEVERKKEEEKLEEEKRLKNILKEQMDVLKNQESESLMLKKQQEDLQQEQWRLERLDEERQRIETARQQREHGRMLLRQHKQQMMRRSKQILDELELDRKILASLVEREQELDHLQTARKEKAQADAAWMKQVIEDQIRLEKAREAELEMLYQDEAARMWQQRDAEWEREKRARERLMREVLDDRQKQIEERIEENRAQQEESLQQREQLLREMDIANQLTRRDQEVADQQKEALKLDLKEQMTARRERDLSARKRLEEELQEDKKEEEDYEEFLRQETQRMKLQGHQEKQFGRRQAWT